MIPIETNKPNLGSPLESQRLTCFKKAMKDMIATSKTAYSKSDAREGRSFESSYTSREIRSIIEQGSAVERAELSEFFFRTSGIYKRIILHYATFLTYSWTLVPHIKKQKDTITDSAISSAYYEASDFCTSFQIERKCTLFAKKVLVEGAYYGIIHDNGDFVAIQDLPFNYCRSRFKNQQDIDIVEFNVKFFDSISDKELRKEILLTYPKCVQKGYDNYSKKNGNCWVYLPAEIGIYFSFFNECPFFLDLIPLLDDLEDYKEIDKKRNLLGLKRILVQQIGVKDGKLDFEPDEASEMHEGSVEMLSDNPDLDVLTTYASIDVKDLSGKDDEKTEVDEVLNLIYESAGISKELFCASTDTGLEFSLKNDLAMMMILGGKFANFFNALVNYKFSNKKVKFNFIILPISYDNSEEYTSHAKDLAAFGYSFLTPILSTGIDQTNLADLKKLENDLLNLDEVLKPLQSTYTQSGKNSGTISTAEVTAAAAKTTDSNETTEPTEQVGDKK